MKSRVIFCGGRDFDNEEAISVVMAEFRQSQWIIVTGGAPGADYIAHEVATRNGYETEVYPALWGAEGLSAGVKRNQRMLLGVGRDTVLGLANMVVAFSGGKGTNHMVTIARKAGVDVYEVRL